jgi:hypothetical protein
MSRSGDGLDENSVASGMQLPSAGAIESISTLAHFFARPTAETPGTFLI